MDKIFNQIREGYFHQSLCERLYTQWRWRIFPFRIYEECIPKSCNILSLACGSGLFEIALSFTSKQRNIKGYDISPQKIQMAKAASQGIPQLDFKVKDFTQLSVQEFEFADVITIVDSLYMIPDFQKQKIANQFYQNLLKKQGLLIIKDIDKNFPFKFQVTWMHDWFAINVLRITQAKTLAYVTKNRMLEILSQAGFKSIETIEAHKGYFYPHIIYKATATA